MVKLSIASKTAIEAAKLHLLVGNMGAFARMLSAVHRAASKPQQAAIWAWIEAEGHTELFTRRNGALIAKEDGACDTP